MKNKLDFAAIVLAAGLGKRMGSPLPKVLHPIGSQPMIVRTVSTLGEINPSQIILVASPKSLSDLKDTLFKKLSFAIQKRPLGTADATSVGLKKVIGVQKTIAVLYGDDTAFYKPETITEIFKYHQKTRAKLTFVTVEVEDPSGLGRVIRKDGKLVAIVEQKDAIKSQKKIREVNDGLYFFNRNWLTQNLPKLKPSAVTGELYLTDLISLALAQKIKVQTFKLKDQKEWHSVNTPKELALANQKLASKIHIMGIAGAGASAVAGIAAGYGFDVSGCDLNPNSAYTSDFKIAIQKDHHPSHTKNIGMLVVSPAVLKFDPKNREILAAKDLKIPILTWQEFQGRLLQQNKVVITVAGAYGKSTTTAMISQISIDADLDPTCEIGAKVLAWGKNFRFGRSKYYICEADEYNDNFLNYHPDIVVILNIAWDHPDYFKNKKQVFESYGKFVSQIKAGGHLIIADDPQVRKLASFASKNVTVVKIKERVDFQLSIIGQFRSQNANAALAIAQILGVDLKHAQKSLEDFRGVARRLEFKGKIDGVNVYDDYAVQPFTVLVTANALQDKFKNKKVALVFEPHTFSRIKSFFDDFVKSLQKVKVDKVLITDVYTARERGDRQKLAQKLASSVGNKAVYSGSLNKTVNYLAENMKNFDIICSMGAGDVYKLYDILRPKID